MSISCFGAASDPSECDTLGLTRQCVRTARQEAGGGGGAQETMSVKAVAADLALGGSLFTAVLTQHCLQCLGDMGRVPMLEGAQHAVCLSFAGYQRCASWVRCCRGLLCFAHVNVMCGTCCLRYGNRGNAPDQLGLV